MRGLTTAFVALVTALGTFAFAQVAGAQAERTRNPILSLRRVGLSCSHTLPSQAGDAIPSGPTQTSGPWDGTTPPRA